MTTLNADHLIDQAERLIISPRTGPPRQADLRRAISSAYYSVFHLCVTSVADEFVGVTQRGSVRYALVYRGVSHRTLKTLCVDASRPAPPRKLLLYFPAGGFDANIRAFASAVIDLQEDRHEADYDPLPRFDSADARTAIDTAKGAIQRFRAANEDHRKTFLTLLLCPPR